MKILNFFKIISVAVAMAVTFASAGLMAAGFVDLARPGPDSATITGIPGAPTQNLYPVRFVAVDDQQINGPREVIWLEPGKYTLTVSAVVTNRPGTRYRSRADQRDDENKIEIEVEAGKHYEVYSLSENGPNGYTFRPVVHKVSD